MENDRCKIMLDRPTGVYYSGETINGTFSLYCKGGKRIRGVYYKLHGYGKCGWYTLLRRTADSSTTAAGNNVQAMTAAPQNKENTELSVQYTGQEEYINETVYLVGSKNGPSFEIPDGTTTYPFSYTLNQNLPSIFRGTYGKIKYKMEFTVDKPWKFDEKYELHLNIYKSLCYNPALITPQQKQIVRNIGYFGSGPISLHILTPRSCCAPGEQLPLQLIVTNRSPTHIDKVKFTLRQIVDYYSSTPSRAHKQEIEKVLRKEAGGVDKNAEQKYEHMLAIPLLPATDNTVSKIIQLRYEIKVEAKISGLYKNLIETMPITITSTPLGIGNSIVAPPTLPVSTDVPPIATPDFSTISQSTPPPIGFVAPLSNPRLSTVSTAPSAPPFDFISVSPNSTRSSICSSQWSDAPPSYEDVFGSPSSMHRSIQSGKNNVTTATSRDAAAVSD